jgi:hypothetical protein
LTPTTGTQANKGRPYGPILMTEQTKDTNPKTAAATYKPSASVVSQLVIMEMNMAMAEGAEKYGRHNYREHGVRHSTYYDATRRHIDSWWEGQDIDPASRLHHITKAITSLTVLRDAMLLGLDIDDRPPGLSPEEFDAFIANLEAKGKGIKETYGHIQPKHVTRTNADYVLQSAVRAASLESKGIKNEENKAGI